jgi:hypothetical protein
MPKLAVDGRLRGHDGWGGSRFASRQRAVHFLIVMPARLCYRLAAITEMLSIIMSNFILYGAIGGNGGTPSATTHAAHVARSAAASGPMRTGGGGTIPTGPLMLLLALR